MFSASRNRFAEKTASSCFGYFCTTVEEQRLGAIEVVVVVVDVRLAVEHHRQLGRVGHLLRVGVKRGDHLLLVVGDRPRRPLAARLALAQLRRDRACAPDPAGATARRRSPARSARPAPPRTPRRAVYLPPGFDATTSVYCSAASFQRRSTHRSSPAVEAHLVGLLVVGEAARGTAGTRARPDRTCSGPASSAPRGARSAPARGRRRETRSGTPPPVPAWASRVYRAGRPCASPHVHQAQSFQLLRHQRLVVVRQRQ